VTVQLATLCDSAADYSGKLCILGAFDTLCAREFPVVHPACALVVRLTFEASDAGKHNLVIRCIDPSGHETLPPFEPVVEVSFPSAFVPFVTRNIVMNLQRLRVEKPGLYRWVLESKGQILATIPLRVTLFDDSRSATGPAG
jgi:hypothetical protein